VTPLRNIVVGAVVATALASMMLASDLGGISLWKYLLAAFGLVLWFAAEKRR
jgi:type IV secretory pathway TrbD component